MKASWAIAGLLLLEMAILPWTGHLFDASVFFTISNLVFFGHVPMTGNWTFGSISLAAVLLSQLPVLVFPALAQTFRVRLFLLKLPSWLADIGTALFVRASALDGSSGNYWALRYLLDPIVIFTTVLHGQWDALPNLFSVAGIACLVRGNFNLAAVLLGLGTGAKFYPAAFTPLLFVVAYKRGSLRCALEAFAYFAGTAAATLLPVFWGRIGYVAHSYAFNSFGPGQGIFTTSLWSLVPRLGLSTRLEQLVAVAIPLALAALELRHVSPARDVARTAMFTAMSVVLLNPGAHPPFFVWIAGPLVLYCAVANDAITSLGGLVLSAVATLTQFCLEGSNEYFLLSTGAVPTKQALACVSSTNQLQWVALLAAAWIVVSSFRDVAGGRLETAWRSMSQIAALVCAAVFFWQIVASVESAAANPKKVPYRFDKDFLLVLAVAPVVRRLDDSCLLTYDTFGSAAFAGIPPAARFVKATLGYTLYSPETIAVRGRTVNVDRMPSRYDEGQFVTIYDGGQVPVTREFDFTSLLRPFKSVQAMVERPCSLVRNNPALIYRFDIDAAEREASREPLLRRLGVLTGMTQ